MDEQLKLKRILKTIEQQNCLVASRDIFRIHHLKKIFVTIADATQFFIRKRHPFSPPSPFKQTIKKRASGDLNERTPPHLSQWSEEKTFGCCQKFTSYLLFLFGRFFSFFQFCYFLSQAKKIFFSFLYECVSLCTIERCLSLFSAPPSAAT